MNFKNLRSILLSGVALTLLASCGSADIISTPIENIDTLPLKEQALTDAEKKTWGHKDLVRDTIPGMSVERAYDEIIKNKKGKTVIVAVIDSGIDIDHEDLDANIWVNEDEIPNNGKDDDNNGYVDDVHGWNFLGSAYDEQLEYVRLLVSGNTNDPRYAEAKSLHEKEYGKATAMKQQYEQIYTAVKNAHQTLKGHFNKEDYTKDEVTAITTEDAELKNAVQTANFVYQNGLDSMKEAVEDIKGGVEHFTEQINFNLNKEFKGRKTGDNPDVLNDSPGYGDNNVKHVKKSESHGTHVAGIIAAERNNGLGANGVANNVKIMSIRTVPNGDEYDKDVALSIRYAVDNGAKVINGSFGKSFSPHSEWVRDAIKYASDNDVVFVHAAGNDSKDVDTEPNFPDDNVNYVEVSDTYIRVGALAPKYGSEMVAGFSNYGKKNVDIFAPGAKIYSTFPENEYKAIGGTSMASPAVAGIAALIRSQYPKLSAADVKTIILNSGLPINTKVIVGGNDKDVRAFDTLSSSGKVANAYNALILAKQFSKNKN